MKRAEPEHQMQVGVFQYCYLRGRQDDRWQMIYAVPNGGDRNLIVARKMKAEGVKKGVPDIVWPIARRGYHGLYIELKAGRNTTEPEQKDWAARLVREGYFYKLIRDDIAEVIATLEWYFEGEVTRCLPS